MSDTAVDIPRLVIPVDSEHGALRFSIVVIFFAGWVVFFAILNSILVSEGLNLIALIGALVLAGLSARAAEIFLQKRWPSGRAVEIDDTRRAIGKARRTCRMKFVPTNR